VDIIPSITFAVMDVLAKPHQQLNSSFSRINILKALPDPLNIPY
jgi:hypothetical protein